MAFAYLPTPPIPGPAKSVWETQKVPVAKINANVYELSLVLRERQGPLTRGLFTL